MPEPTEEIVDPGTQPGGEQDQTQPPAVPPAAPPVAPPAAVAKNIVIPTASMRRIKDEEFARGKSAALEEYAKAQGYTSAEEMQQVLAKAKQPQQPAAPQNQPPQDPLEEDPAAQLAKDKEARREEGRYQRQLEKVLNERNRYAQQATDFRKQVDEAKAETDAVKAEMYLRTVAAGVGIQDIDYAITLFSREVEKMTPEQAETFDEKAWFAGLRSSKPILFGEAVVPVTTGTGTGGAPKPPGPATVSTQNGQNGRADARKMNPAEYRAELARRGITPGV
jgi:hypothetical protein